jgi:hypothetical protein
LKRNLVLALAWGNGPLGKFPDALSQQFLLGRKLEIHFSPPPIKISENASYDLPAWKLRNGTQAFPRAPEIPSGGLDLESFPFPVRRSPIAPLI